MADPKLVKDLLEKGPWSLRNISKPDLSNADLSGAILRYFKAPRANFRNTTFKGSDLRESYFMDAICINTDFTEAILEDSSFFQAKLNNAIFKDANLRDAGLENVDLTRVDFEGADLKGVSFKWSNLEGVDLSTAKNVEFIGDLEGSCLKGTKGIPLKVSTKFRHDGETVEEEEERLREELSQKRNASISKLEEAYEDTLKLTKSVSEIETASLPLFQMESEVKSALKNYGRAVRVYKEVRDGLGGIYGLRERVVLSPKLLQFYRTFVPMLEKRNRDLRETLSSIGEKVNFYKDDVEKSRQRARVFEDVTLRVSRAKEDKELEALAEEVGSLQARPEYVREYKRDLEDLQAEIERKYSVVGKGIRYLKRLFSRGRKASQIRVASQMNRELQREIKALKRDLNK